MGEEDATEEGRYESYYLPSHPVPFDLIPNPILTPSS
jgi:hypothetical protein